MNFEEVKEKLETSKRVLQKKLENPNLTLAEREILLNEIHNLEYILELTDMNHFQRGFVLH
ncbi:DUF3896 family protein [Bacillus sp. BRMEA1]|uniref:DUF3896 family protein n=1 Tax=Neobacillus endophyticus TaxID=2738405 RepID=UPI001563EC91|nr:DUF3896 family protein [Neobacillus endophyticus]NRD79711.1 DUF3896 family protein [Neobacillus endophyticus]